MSLRFTRLTRPAIRQLKPGRKLTEHGITAACTPTGDIRYSVGVMVDGERIHRVIGKGSEGVTRTQAEEFIARARSDAKEGRLNLPTGRKTPLTFGEAVDTYLSEQEATGGKNLAPKKAHIKMHLKPYFGTMLLERITTFTIGKFKKDRRDAGLSVATINRNYQCASRGGGL